MASEIAATDKRSLLPLQVYLLLPDSILQFPGIASVIVFPLVEIKSCIENKKKGYRTNFQIFDDA